MHEQCLAEVFPPSTADECNRLYARYAVAIIGLILFSWIPAVRCRLHQILFRLRYCGRGNSDATIDLLADPNEWLNDNPHVAQAIVWQTQKGNSHPYAQWSRAEKLDLYNAFWKARMDEETFGRLPPGSARPETVGGPLGTYYPPVLAWQLFIAYVGQSLAIEYAHWVPWSITSYTAEQLATLLDSRSFFEWDAARERYSINPYATGWVTPADPVRTYRFLRDNGMVGATSRQTVENLLEWCRYLLRHFTGGYDISNFVDHWQYSGLTPVDRMLIETRRASDGVYANFTAGCWGTTGFLRAVLRVVNLPVVIEQRCGHALPAFIRDGLHLCHGDDPYDHGALYIPARPVGELLIDEPTYQRLFGPEVSEAEMCRNIGYGVVEELMRHPTANNLLVSRCYDLRMGYTNQNSTVYRAFRDFHSLSELEAMNLWGRLDEEIQNRGGCDNIHYL